MKKSLILINLLLVLAISSCGTNSSSEVTDLSSDVSSDTSSPIKNTFTITYVNYDNSVLYSYEAEKLSYPKYVGETPTREPSNGKTYTFAGWTPKPDVVKEDATYTATYRETEQGIYLGEIENEYYLYKDYIKTYLLSTNNNDMEDSTTMNVHNYIQSGEAYKPVTLTWTQNYQNVTGINFTYSINNDYSNGKTINLDANATSVNLYNLYKGTTYYAKIDVLCGANIESKEFTFNTSNLGPRAMKVDGITNVRDLGGYQTVDGKVTLQNMIYRGSEMNGIHSYQITEDGLRTMSEEMGIKLDIDLRNSSELKTKEGVTIIDTPIPNARVEFLSCNNYVTSIQDSTTIAKIFKLLADKRNYPTYIHCYGGADRTGTVCFLINALLGVSLDDLIHDYEFTSFSAIGERNAKNVTTGSYTGQFYAMYHKLLELYPEGNLSQKVEKYLLKAGLTSNEIYNIKAINLGEPINITAKVNQLYCSSFVDKLVIDINEMNGLKEVYVDDNKVNYTLGDYQIFVANSELTGLVGNSHTVKLIYEGKEDPVTCTFKSLNEKVYEVEELYTINDSSACVKADTTFKFSEYAIGYGTYVRARIKTETKQNSGFYFMIGSYGVYLRGKQVRLQRMTSSYSPGVNADYGVMGTFPAETMFNNGNLDIVLGISTDEYTVGVTFIVLNDDGSIYSDMFYVFISESLKYTSGEISSSNAKFGFKFANDYTLGDGIYAYAHTQKAYVDPTYSSNEFKVYLRDVDESAKLYINDIEFNYVLDGFTMIVNQKDMLAVAAGTAHGLIVLDGKNFEFTFVREEITPYYESTYMYGNYVITLPGCDESTIVKLNNTQVDVSTNGDDIIISESVLDNYGFEEISGQIINASKTYDFAFTKVKANVGVAPFYISGDLTINLPGVNNTATLYIGSDTYSYTIDDEFNMVVVESSLSALPFGDINGHVQFKNNSYEFSFNHANAKENVVLGDGTFEYVDSVVLSYDGAMVDFDIVTNTAGSGNGHLVAGIGGYGINFRGGRLRWYSVNKTSGFVTSDFDAKASIEQDGKFSESNFSSAPGHIRLVSSVDAEGKVTLIATITVSKQVSSSYADNGTYTYTHTFAKDASSITGNDVHSYFSIDGTKQISATISNYVVISGK